MKKSVFMLIFLMGLFSGKIYSQSLSDFDLQAVQEKLMQLTLDFKGNATEIEELVEPLTVPERHHLFNNMQKNTYGFSFGSGGLSFSLKERMSVFPEPAGSRMAKAETFFAVGSLASIAVLSTSSMVFFVEMIFGVLTMFTTLNDSFDVLSKTILISGISTLIFGVPYLGLETAASIQNIKNKSYNRKLEKALKIGKESHKPEDPDNYISVGFMVYF